MAAAPIDPNSGPPFVLEGRIVTMDDKQPLLENGRLYVSGGVIAAVQDAAAAPPKAFEQVPVVPTGGTIYPGLIELHNHLSYDVLPLWQVPKLYTNRNQWQKAPAYGQIISGPMKVLGTLEGYPEAIVRYAECKCLLGGVTTSQGVGLFSFSGISTYYKGIVRNVERTDDLTLPAWKSHIADVAASNGPIFLNSLEHARYLLHLSEGTDDAAHNHFESLHLKDGSWAITSNLAGIHCVALNPADFETLKANGGSMVWSPLSNLLLYGQTADIAAAKAANLTIGLGSDWSPSGSKNLFAELKIARLVAQQTGTFSDQELLQLATTNAAKILGWQNQVGSLTAQKRADLLVIAGTGGAPYSQLLDASEADIELVAINGVARYGTEKLMTALAPQPDTGLEPFNLGSNKRLLDLRQTTEFAKVAALTLNAATTRLTDGLAHLPDLTSKLLKMPASEMLGLAGKPATTMLILDHDEPAGTAIRPHLDHPTQPTDHADPGTATLLAHTLKPIAIDPISVTTDPNYASNLQQQRNLPPYLKTGLQTIY